MAATLEAWEQAGLSEAPPDPERTALVVAGNNVNALLQSTTAERYAESPSRVSPRYILRFMDTDHVGSLSEILQIRGEGFTVGGASASGNVGIIKGLQLIQLGVADVCLVVGALADLSGLELQGFHNSGALAGAAFAHAPQQACRPFDERHQGFVYGQGSACLVLESRASARARGARSLAELCGGALVLDGSAAPSPSVNGEARAMSLALARAGWRPEEVDYVNAHGTSSPKGDDAELEAIRKVFGAARRRVRINSTKALTGHCLWSAGVVEAIATVIQLGGGFLHGNPNLVRPTAEGFGLVGREAEGAAVARAISNSFAFGGINTCVAIAASRRG
jgi:malonyl-ACP decarboxylase